MPKPQTINNPDDAHVTVSDYQTGLDDSGGEIALGNEIETFVAGGTISRGDAVKLTGSTGAAVKPTVSVFATTDDVWNFVGIARHDAASDELVEVVIRGFALASVLAGAAVDEALSIGASDGDLDTLTVDATVTVGEVFAVALAATQTPDLTPVYVKHL